MTSAEASQPRPRSVWLAHHQIGIYLLYIMFLIVQQLWPHRFGLDIVEVPMSIAVVATQIGSLRHHAILCTRCAADFPSNGSDLADEHLSMLRLYHEHGKRLVLSALCALALVGAVTLTGWLYIPIWIYLTFDVYLAKTHRRLEPWCPWCRGRWDGDNNVVVLPIPTGEATR